MQTFNATRYKFYNKLYSNCTLLHSNIDNAEHTLRRSKEQYLCVALRIRRVYRRFGILIWALKSCPGQGAEAWQRGGMYCMFYMWFIGF